MTKIMTVRKRGRPSKYTQKLADRIIARIENGESERKICLDDDMPTARTLQRWKEERDEFCRQSARAREASAAIFNDRRMEKSDALYQAALEKLSMGQDFPKGFVEAVKASMQEDAREAALRDDSKFGDRKTVKVEAPKEVTAGMAELYAKMRAAVLDDDEDEED